MAETRYVQRDGTGKIVAHFANPQPGLTAEALPDTHPDLLAYASASAPPPAPQQAERAITSDAALKGIVRALARRFGLTEQQLIDAIKAELT